MDKGFSLQLFPRILPLFNSILLIFIYNQFCNIKLDITCRNNDNIKKKKCFVAELILIIKFGIRINKYTIKIINHFGEIIFVSIEKDDFFKDNMKFLIIMIS